MAKVKHLGKVKKPPAKAKFDYLTRQEVKAFAQKLYSMGYTQWDIAHKIREKWKLDTFHQSNVSDMLREVREEWKEASINDLQRMVDERVAELREVRREAYEAWLMSKEPSKTTTRTKVRTDSGELITTELVATLENRLPYNQYLTTILNTIQTEIELRGLAAPTKVDMKSVVTQLDWSALLSSPDPKAREEQRVRVEATDPIEAAIASASPAPTPTSVQPTPTTATHTEPSTNGTH